MSLGRCENIFSSTDTAAVNNAVRAAQAAGTTALVASGDSGLECLGFSQADPRIPAQGISFPGDLPRVTSVGGTVIDCAVRGGYGICAYGVGPAVT